MFRFLHTADLHLDSPLRGLGSREGAPVEELRGASRRALDLLVELAKSEKVDFVIIAGDIYDRDWKDYSTGLFFRSRMARLNEAGIPVYMISGNHDAASVISRKLSLPDNVTVFSSRSPETFDVPGLPVALHGMSFPNRAVDENLVPRYPEPIAEKFNIGILHTSLAGAAGHDTYAPCSVSDLTQKGYDYWALGHIHQPEVIAQDPWIVFPGNIQGRHARECGERGCVIVTVDDSSKVSSLKKFPLDLIRWSTIEVNVSNSESVEEVFTEIRAALGNALEEAGDRLLAVRVILAGVTPLHGIFCSHPDRIDAEIEAISQDFGEGRIWIERIKLTTRPAVRLEDLADRDALTATVLDALTESHTPGTVILPSEVTSMLEALPNELAKFLKDDWTGSSHPTLIEDACSMILERLLEKGAKS